MTAPTVVNPFDSPADLLSAVRRLSAAYADAMAHMVSAVAIGDHASAEHWDLRARHVERELLYAGRLLLAYRAGGAM